MSDNLQPYPDYKESGVSWLRQIPAHWGIHPGLAAYRPKQHKNTGMLETTVLSLSYGQIVIKPPEKLHGLVPESFETYQIVDPGDIIIRPTDLQNDWVSLRVGLSKHRGIITSAYLCLRTLEGMTSEYCYLLLHAYDLMKIFYGMGSGLRQNLDSTDLKRMPVIVPPPEEQIAIVRYLDHVDRRIRRYIRTKQTLIKLLNEQKQVIIQQAVIGGLNLDAPRKDSGVEWLGEVPAHWDVKRLKWVTRLQRGYDLPRDRRKPGNIPVVSSGGVIDTHNEARALGPGVVIGRYGSTDAVFYIEKDFWPHNTALFVTNFYENNIRWCFYLLRIISKADHASKSAVPGVDRKDLYGIPVTCPPPEEQEKIAIALDQKLIDLNLVTERVEHEINLMHEYRTRLIADVVTGKLDVRAVAVQLPAEIDEPDALEELDELVEEDDDMSELIEEPGEE